MVSIEGVSMNCVKQACLVEMQCSELIVLFLNSHTSLTTSLPLYTPLIITPHTPLNRNPNHTINRRVPYQRRPGSSRRSTQQQCLASCSATGHYGQRWGTTTRRYRQSWWQVRAVIVRHCRVVVQQRQTCLVAGTSELVVVVMVVQGGCQCCFGSVCVAPKQAAFTSCAVR